MACGGCGHDNEANAKFCSQCGAPLVTRCGSCAADQPPGAKFCNQCGSPIDATSAVDPAVEKAARVPTAVRKNVTALFGDLVGSTTFGERVDPEAARAALAPYFELLRSTIEDHAGTVVKFTGDGVMAIFGLPEVAEDDALRAVAAGLELQRRFRWFADSVRDQHGVELGMRVGINTGELVTGEGDADLVGDVLNTAARLEAACHPGRVMVGEDTWRLTRSAVSYEVLGEVRVKGKTDALATFQVVDDARGAVEDTTPFVGRRDELGALRSAFDDTLSSATAKLVTVIGAPGVGKTRLAAELRSGVDARTFDLRIERRGSTTFTPVVELLRELTGSGSAEDIAVLVAEHAEATRLARVLATFIGQGEVRSTEESFWAVRRLLEHLAATEPLVVVVDDIQWAEPLFWDLLDHLVEWTEAPVLLVALARPELRELRSELTQPGRRVTASVSLEGLDADTTRELAAGLLDTDELPADLIERIPDSTEGNPLFVRELVQMLVDDGVLARDGDRWRLTIDADAIEVPPTVLSLLASRVERLPDDERQVVELASVIGTEFDRGLLDSLAGIDIRGRLGALIDRLRRKDLIEPSGAWAGDHPVYRFHHVLVRDAAYRRLLKGHRADLHERVGRYLDAQGADGDETDVIVAFHYEQVHRYRVELGTLDDATRALAAQSSERLRRAAEQALAREDLSSAGGYAERALAITDDEGERSELLLVGCEALLSSGDVGRGAALVDQVGALDAGHRLAAWADCFRAQLWSLTDPERLSEAAELAVGAAGRLDALDDQAGVAKARLVRASTLARLGRIGECEAELDLALGAARTAGDRRRTVAVLGAAPLAALWGPSPVARAGGRCLDVLRLLRITSSSPAVEATSIRCQGLLEALRGRFDSAHEKFEVSRTSARDLGLRQGLYETELFEGFAELLAEDPVAAEPHLRLARDGLGAMGIGADAGQAAALLARSLLRQGRIDEADELATAALATAGENLQTAVASRAVLGEIRAVQGRADEAEALVVAAIEIAERTDIVLDHAIALRSAARIAGLRGDDSGAERYRAASDLLLADKGVTGLAAAWASTTEAPAHFDDASDSATKSDAAERPLGAMRRNAAADAMEAIVQARSREDLDDVRQRFHPDFVARFQSRVFGTFDDTDLDEFIGNMAGGVLDIGGAFETEVVALRGANSAMSRLRIVIGNDVSDRLTVWRLDHGLVRELVFFDGDQLREAYDELDRQWVEFASGNRDALTNHLAMQAAIEIGDVAALRAQMDDEFVSVDHRPLGLGTRTRDDFLETFRPDNDGTTILRSFEIVDPIGVDESGALLHVRLTSGDDSTVDVLTVAQQRSGRIVRQELFPLDRLDDARRCFDELTNPSAIPGGRVLSNAASRALDAAWADAVNAGDLDRFVALLDPDYVHQLHQRLQVRESIGADDAVELTRSMISGRVSATTETLAVRGDNVALGRWAGTFGTDIVELLAITVVGDTGGIVRGETFEPEDLHDALDRLDEIHAERHGASSFLELMGRLRRAAADGDRDAARGFLAPGWISHDGRPLGLGVVDREEFLRSSVWAGAAYIVMEVVGDTGSVALTHDRWVAPDGSRWEHLAVMTYAAGLSVSLEVYALDDLATAEERLAELAAGSPVPLPAVPPFANEATRLLEEFVRLVKDTGVDSARHLVGPDFVSRISQVSLMGVLGDVDVDGHLALISGAVSDGASITVDHLIAIRGDQLCLHRLSLRRSDALSERLCVSRAGGGLAKEVVWFDGDDLRAALDELERQWAATGGPATYLAVRRRFGDAGRAGDVTAARAVLADDFSALDHRPLGLGTRNADEFIESMQMVAGFSSGSTSIVVQPIAWTDRALLYRQTIATEEDLGDVSFDLLCVTAVQDGKITNWDNFDLDQFDAARARFDELVAAEAVESAASEPDFANAAWRAFQAGDQAMIDGDKARYIDTLTPAFVLTARTPFRLSAEIDRIELADALFVARSLGANHRTGAEFVAARGDDLCLVRARLDVDDNAQAHLVVVRAAQGRVDRMFAFDDTQLREAHRELDEQYGAALGLSESSLEGLDVLLSLDPRRIGPWLHSDFRFRDHRGIGWPDLDRDRYLTEFLPSIPTSITMIVRQVDIFVEGQGMVEHHSLVDGDGSIDTSAVGVSVLDGEQLIAFEVFAPDDLEAALARFAELTGDDRAVAAVREEAARRGWADASS